jgi:carboxypeptidase C (cathepsin A)
MRSTVVIVAFLALFVALASAQLPSTYYSGFVTVNAQSDANLFYYLVPSQSNPKTDPVILWLQGGPGCSSLFGSFVENGPFLVQNDGSFKPNPYTWNTNATMIWIDSPVGTGFSYVKDDDYASDEKTIANDLYTALQSILFTKYPQFGGNAFYIFGESYGGKYVPWLASTILTNNQQPRSKTKINLKAIGIGNGWVDPYVQTGSYAPFLYANGRVDAAEVDASDAIYEGYKGAIDIGAYDVAMIIGNDLLNGLMAAAGVNDVYDIRKASDPTTPLADKLGRYLNNPSTKKALNVTSDRSWGLCDTAPYFALMSDIDRASVTLVPGILAKIPVMLYNGNYDLICNLNGTAAYSSAMVWPGQKAFNSAQTKTWNGPSGVAGTYKAAQGLVRTVVYNAGHMSPYDQPANLQYLVWQFIGGLLN